MGYICPNSSVDRATAFLAVGPAFESQFGYKKFFEIVSTNIDIFSYYHIFIYRLSYGVMAAPDILAVVVHVRVMMGQQI